jgi:hypothetical protein
MHALLDLSGHISIPLSYDARIVGAEVWKNVRGDTVLVPFGEPLHKLTTHEMSHFSLPTAIPLETKPSLLDLSGHISIPLSYDARIVGAEVWKNVRGVGWFNIPERSSNACMTSFNIVACRNRELWQFVPVMDSSRTRRNAPPAFITPSKATVVHIDFSKTRGTIRFGPMSMEMCPERSSNACMTSFNIVACRNRELWQFVPVMDHNTQQSYCSPHRLLEDEGYNPIRAHVIADQLGCQTQLHD